MKKSALKKYIKEEIINVLATEASKEEVENQKELNKELEKTVNLSKQMGLKEEDDVEVKDDYHKVDDEDDVKPVDAPAGDKEIQKKATKADIIIKTYKDLRQILQRYRTAYDNAKNETDKQEAFQLLKKFSQNQEYQNAKKKYEALKTIKL